MDPLLWECILKNAFMLHSLENAFSRMYFAENNAFGKILKLFLKSDYAKSNVFGWYFRECILPIK